jgi:5-methyltetrahydropteroyltriglutamate--homocysteine methyltransferase
MPTKVTDTILPTTMIGSYPKPRWYTRYNLAGADLLEWWKLEENWHAWWDATTACIKDQELAGLDIVTDGQMHFDDYGGGIGSFVWYWYERLGGFTKAKLPNPLATAIEASEDGDLSQAAWMHNWGGTAVTGDVSRGIPGRLGEMYQSARKLTDKPIKVSVGAGPPNLTYHVDFNAPGSTYKEARRLAEDLVPIFNEQLRALVAAGCDFIQIDDLSPWLLLQGPHNHWIVDVLNGVIDGVDAKIAWHCCTGATYGSAATDLTGRLRTIFEAMYVVDVDQYVLDFAHGAMSEIGVLADLPADKEVAVGVIDVRTLQIESEDEVAQRMHAALEVVPAERLWFTTDCGMKALHRFTAQGKLHALTGAAQRVRAELPTPSAPR